MIKYSDCTTRDNIQNGYLAELACFMAVRPRKMPGKSRDGLLGVAALRPALMGPQPACKGDAAKRLTV
jgi:hypothetical protein